MSDQPIASSSGQMRSFSVSASVGFLILPKVAKSGGSRVRRAARAASVSAGPCVRAADALGQEVTREQAAVEQSGDPDDLQRRGRMTIRVQRMVCVKALSTFLRVSVRTVRSMAWVGTPETWPRLTIGNRRPVGRGSKTPPATSFDIPRRRRPRRGGVIESECHPPSQAYNIGAFPCFIKLKRLDFIILLPPAVLSESDLVASKNVTMKTYPEAPHQITQSQQVRRISARRERISAVSAWAQWGASRLQPSKTTRNSGRASERRTGLREGWRRDRDSNPGWGHPHNGFRDRPVRPLRHLSAAGGS